MGNQISMKIDKSFYHAEIYDHISTHPPFLVWMIFLFSATALIQNIVILGYKSSGLAWLFSFIFSVFIILKNPAKINFPIKIWFPWIILLLIHLIVSEQVRLHRTIQLICPIVVGMAISTYHINGSQLSGFIKLCKWFSITLIFISLYNTGFLFTGKIPAVTGLAAQTMTAVLFCSLFAVIYTASDRKALFWWSIMAALPVFAVTRATMIVAGLTLPLTLAPMRLKKRILILITVLLIGIGLFYTERLQNKMFYSGTGRVSDIQTQNFRDTGRRFMWDAMWWRIKEKPWTGYGTGSGESFTNIITRGVGYPHNDWLLTLNDQGIVGALIYGLCLFMASFHAWRKSRETSGETRLLFLAGASSFIPLALIMLADNIMVYASYYGNLQFTILGLAYAAEKSRILPKSAQSTFG